MSETFHVKATERGVIRIFTANLTTEQAERFTERPDEDSSRSASSMGWGWRVI